MQPGHENKQLLHIKKNINLIFLKLNIFKKFI